MKNVVIVSGARTPVGQFGGGLKDIPVVDLGALALKAALKKAGLRPVAGDELKSMEPEAIKNPEMIELEKSSYDYDGSLTPVVVGEVIMGNVLGAGQGQNVARQAMIKAGIPKETNAFTVNKVCASGMKAIALAAQSIMLGDADVMMAGGMENMSRVPFAMPTARWGARMFNTEMIDLMVFDGLWEIFYGYHMGITAENIAATCGISRKEQDELGAESHARALKAIKSGLFKDEIVPVPIPQRKGAPVMFDTDERPMETSAEKMGALKPVFKKDGTVTAGNASGINDAAAALVLMSEDKARELGMKPLASIKAFASGGVDPSYMGLGPIPAIKKVYKKAGVSSRDIGRIELNEAFASQAIGCMKELKLDPDKTNVVGSGISIGHPIGCTGARIVITLANEMKRSNTELGLASLCIGGGQGMAMLIENV